MSLRRLAGAAMAALAAVSAAPAPQQVFRGGTHVVSVDVAVRDGNAPVAGLGAADFIVFDNGVRQTIDSVSLAEVPVDITLFLGTMNQSSARTLADLAADLRTIDSLLRPDDRVRLLTLGNQVRDVFGWRRGDEAAAAIDVTVGGVQSLYDACLAALMHRPEPDRRHLIVAITDGIELGSVVDSATVRDVARQTDAVLHLVFVDPVPPPASARNVVTTDPRVGRSNARTSLLNPTGSEYLFLRTTWMHVLPDDRGRDHLREAALSTGGTARSITPGTSVVETFRQAFDDFRQSYLLRYTPRDVAPGGWHDLRVELAGRSRHDVRARKGYFGG